MILEREKGRRKSSMSEITRDEAFTLLKKYNKDPFHIQHALTVEAVMKWYARELGYGAEEEHWGIVGLLHDIDFELYPEQHCVKCVELLQNGGVPEDMIKKCIEFSKAGLTVCDNSRIALTRQGFLVSNAVISELI